METTKNRSHGSCSRIRFGHPQADAIVGPNGVISSGHLIKVEAGARVRFLAADNNPYDFSVQRIAIPRAFIEVRSLGFLHGIFTSLEA